MVVRDKLAENAHLFVIKIKRFQTGKIEGGCKGAIRT